MEKDSYKANEFMRIAQNFIFPIYVKGLNGKYKFSSTCTLIRYKTNYFIVFAAHAIEKDTKLEDIAIFLHTPTPTRLVDISIRCHIYDEYDIVVVNCREKKISHRYYFNLQSEYPELGCLMGPVKHNIICRWIGFPSAWSKYHQINALAHLETDEENNQKYLIFKNHIPISNKSCRFFSIPSDIREYTTENIKGIYDRKNADLKFQGKVDMAIKASGMSGGAIFTYSNSNGHEKPEDCFFLLGIGLAHDYKETNVFSGVSNIRLLAILDDFFSKSPDWINVIN